MRKKQAVVSESFNRTAIIPLCRVTLLGDFGVWQGGTVERRFRTRQTASLLAYLAFYRGRPQSRESLIARYWPDVSLTSGRNRMSIALWHLRSVLNRTETGEGNAHRSSTTDEIGGPLQSNRSEVWLSADLVTTDVAEFEAALAEANRETGENRTQCLERALQLYSGRLLPDLYDDWILPEAERFQERFFAALSERVARCESDGNLLTAIAYARRAVQTDPTRKEAARELIRLLLATGDKAGARRRFDEFARVLQTNDETPPVEMQAWFAASPLVKPSAPFVFALPATVSRAGNSGDREADGNANVVPETRNTATPRIGSPLFGRENELAELWARLRKPGRTVTLVGAGGTGKTRLSREIAHRWTSEIRGHVWWVSLAEVTSPSHIPATVARILGLPPTGDDAQSCTLAIVNWLANRSEDLLILDNYEHLLVQEEPDVSAESYTGADLVRVLTDAGSARILVTSRQPLGIAGEHVWALAPLTVPSADRQNASPSLLARSPGVALFVHAARQSYSAWNPAEEHWYDIAYIVRRLDGVPLAIELAAARVTLLSVRQIAEALAASTEWTQTTRLLRTGTRENAAIPPRHKSLDAAIRWSYDLLTPRAQALFAALSVFVGGATAEAITFVANTPETLDVLEHLCDVSLVQCETPTGSDPVRFTLLEVVRQFAQECCRLHWSDGDPQRRHAAYYLQFAERTEPLLYERDQNYHFRALDAERANLYAALDTLGARGAFPNPVSHARLVSALWWFWWQRVFDRQALITHLEEAVKVPASPGDKEAARLRARALHTHVVTQSGRITAQQAHAMRNESIALARSSEHKETLATILAYGSEDDLLLEEASRLARETNASWALTYSLNNRGTLARAQGEPHRAILYYEEAQAITRHRGDRVSELSILAEWGYLHSSRGELRRAAELLGEGVQLEREIAYALRRPHIGGWTSNLLAGALMALGQVWEAEPLADDAVQIFRLVTPNTTLPWVLITRALLHLGRGPQQWAQARALLLEARACGDAAYSPLAVSHADAQLARLALCEKNTAQARLCADRSLAVFTNDPDPRLWAHSHHVCALIALTHNDLDEAAQCVRESLAAYQKARSKTGVALALSDASAVYAARGEMQEAALLLGMAAALRDAIGYILPFYPEGGLIQEVESRVRLHLSFEAWESCYDEGRKEGARLLRDLDRDLARHGKESNAENAYQTL